MSIATDKKIFTDEEFRELSKDGSHYELINRELVEIGNSSMEHGNLTEKLRYKASPNN